MKIIILGGYGIFGGRLCQLLAPDARLSLFVAGRSYKNAEALCQSLPPGAHREPLEFDRDKDIHALLQLVRPDLVIDASGPFQTYGADPYRLVKACLANDVNYLDFADGSDFVKGIGQFDALAKSQNLFILSGVSSFPVLTAAVVRRLSLDLDQIKSIRGGIAPSSFAVVGLNVMRAISAYAGKPIGLVRDGRHAVAYALTEGMRFTVSPPGRLPLNNTYFSLVDVPDLQVLPELWPGLNSIWMGAGPVPEILHRVLNVLAWLVRLRILPSLNRFAPLFFWAINTFRCGEHRGGMFVEIDGVKKDGATVTRSWHLLAERDDGPFIPCMALEAMIVRILNGNSPPVGARPASRDLELDDYERLFERRTIFTGRRDSAMGNPPHSLFKTLLGSAWSVLPKPIQEMHDTRENLHMSGTAMVVRGKGWIARLIAALFQFPIEGKDISIDVRIRKSAESETWERTFAGRSFTSVLSLGEGQNDRLLCERFGPFSFGIALVIDDEKLRYIVRRWKLWGLPLPRALAPGGDSYESSKNGRFGFDIEIMHPLTGLIVKYSGELAPITKGH